MDVRFQFGQCEENAFHRLKLALIEKPVLRLYNPKAETELHTDASMHGYGAILLQKNSESDLFHPIYNISRAVPRLLQNQNTVVMN
ncbi:hypothetical protein WN55_01194 [Dufourea novaeangliae]|uniref:Reverse transcriptase/retrotransposon-derived protein RNase H-like domain-containing protein n=1 Tax=Dufourea novaeangliae TaxID=178035 RepID=A0A154PCG7_DUFNO|nr:hypothetical protein WN55_01194 [Dufourea novaeangliae]